MTKLQGRSISRREFLKAAAAAGILAAADLRAAGKPGRIPRSFSGRCVQIDPGFAYYKNRSAESIVAEVRARGFDAVSLVATSESGIDAGLVQAFNMARLPLRMLTFGNGTYSRADLPAGWEKWMMVLRQTQGVDGFVYLCPNNPDYRAWKKKQLVGALSKHRFDAIDICESFFPAYSGPESTLYGCLCKHCRERFRKANPQEKGIPEFTDKASPLYWRSNQRLYRKWVDFRVASVAGYLDDLVNGPGGIRKSCPGVAVCTWSLAADLADGPARMREWEALDASAICSKVRPDVHCFQTDWPDWIKPELRADYPRLYKPFVEKLRKTDPRVPLTLQIDIGSRKEMRRDGGWIAACEKAAKEAGFVQALAYEFHLGLDTYTRPPRLVEAKMTGADSVLLVFDKRLDPAVASSPDSYSLPSGRPSCAVCDGNLVNLKASGVRKGDRLSVLACADDPGTRFWKDYAKPNPSPRMSCVIGDQPQV